MLISIWILSCFSCQEKQLNYLDQFVRASSSETHFGPYAMNMSETDFIKHSQLTANPKKQYQLNFREDSTEVIETFNFDEQGMYHYEIKMIYPPEKEQLQLQCKAYLDRFYGSALEELPNTYLWRHQAGASQYLWIQLKPIDQGFIIQWDIH